MTLQRERERERERGRERKRERERVCVCLCARARACVCVCWRGRIMLLFFVMFVTVSVLADVPPAVLIIETPPAASQFTKQGKLKTERSCQNFASDSQGT